MSSSDDLQKQLQSLTDDYQKLQEDLTTLVSARQRLSSQHAENESVRREFAALADDARIFKQVGPVLLRQDRGEARLAVDARLEYIGGELKRVEEQIAEAQGKSEGKKMQIYQVQTQAQQAGGAESAVAA